MRLVFITAVLLFISILFSTMVLAETGIGYLANITITKALDKMG